MITQKELDVMWSIATGKSIENNQPYTRYEFAKMVAEAEREACAKVCDEQADELYESIEHHKCAKYLAEQIRARGDTK